MNKLAAGLLALSLAGCGGGGGNYTPPATGGGTPPPPPPPTKSFVALKLSDGTTVTSDAPPALDASHIIFRKISGTAPLSLVDAVDESGLHEATGSATVAVCYISTHEVTQAQWGSLAAFAPTYAAPWTPYSTDAALGGAAAVSANKPVFGVSWTALQAVLTSWNAGTPGSTTLRAPTPNEWEFACRGGATTATRYHWGSSEDPATAGTYALVRQTRTAAGPGTCGQRSSNALNLYDMSGNVWEWVYDGTTASLRGGSWSDNLRSAASGNSQAMAPDVPYPTAGVRLILELP